MITWERIFKELEDHLKEHFTDRRFYTTVPPSCQQCYPPITSSDLKIEDWFGHFKGYLPEAFSYNQVTVDNLQQTFERVTRAESIPKEPEYTKLIGEAFRSAQTAVVSVRYHGIPSFSIPELTYVLVNTIVVTEFYQKDNTQQIVGDNFAARIKSRESQPNIPGT